ncbi:AmmeMemoRadiSam system radical SAM enzyme [Psychrobium sp. 1_MG-2023]|uniref:AmmeMemoRadiSam system radical SAM enzyme n=1 Tax=Psychrobium sp. 1_MG-2023 TaxID=3062624 RepID=UPI000C34E177|nr:AmmeMemoRadiSam system radical SAM enzyme [Psychrobium sp. 1_MG-2023]MDP2561632.1 AmmeMemoRadiSam system radical SAM enzyme [Psychrobium sp. 1_MG-2023]PKF55728.1 AmmeMemoRadiSam system radical SAM enzyme [Alteromonadales bacterium alter-6D02]
MNKAIIENFPTKYWQALDDGRVRCDVCPQHCTLREGKRGSCFVRKHHQGGIVLTSYGRSSGFCIDPIEKKPLNHFLPGSSVLSFGTAGCNLSCQFCQNWDISKSRQLDSLCDNALPEQLAQAASHYGCRSLAFTYNDPVIFLEYAIDTAIAAKAKGINSVAVSAGYICDEPRVEFFQHMDAANIDLKSFSEQFYHKVCHAHLQPVLETLLYLKHETTVWFEITNLLIPGENDSEAELNLMCQWIAENLGSDVPLHFSAFHPDFKMLDKPVTPLATLQKARNIALSYGLHYVYCGNVHDSESDSTYCPQCHQRVIERDWYQLGRYQLDAKGHCQHCGYTIAGYYSGDKGTFGSRRIPISMT